VTEPGRASRVLVISLMKSGTHLIQELMVGLGYGIHGQSRIGSEIKPKLDPKTKQSLVHIIFGAHHPSEDQEKLAEEAWEAFGWAWQSRLGTPFLNRYGTEKLHQINLDEALARTAGSRFSETPENICWILPQLDLPRVDGQFLSDWDDTGCPKIIFNYRDPRDVLLSMINFLDGKTAKGIGNFSDFTVFARTLASKPSLSDKLRYALADPSFPGRGDFERSLWLLHHPNVCKVSFEQLIGARGGGSDEEQADAIRQVTDFLGAEITPDEVADRLFNTNSFSFYKGQIGNWRKEMSERDQELCTEFFGPVLKEYGYSTT
jgi:hypothetical protein